METRELYKQKVDHAWNDLKAAVEGTFDALKSHK